MSSEKTLSQFKMKSWGGDKSKIAISRKITARTISIISGKIVHCVFCTEADILHPNPLGGKMFKKIAAKNSV